MLNSTNRTSSAGCGGMGTMYETSLLSRKTQASSQAVDIVAVAYKMIPSSLAGVDRFSPIPSEASSSAASLAASPAIELSSNPIIQRIVECLSSEKKEELLAAANVFFNKDTDAERRVGILRSLSQIQEEGHLQSFVEAWRSNPAGFPLISSVGDPEVERILKEWPITADAFDSEEKTQLNAIKGALLAGNLPLGLVLDGMDAEKSLFLGLQAQEIKAGDVIGIYAGFYQLLPEDNLASTHPYVYDCLECSSEKSEKVEPRIALGRDPFSLATRAAKSQSDRMKYRIVISAGSVCNYTRFISNSSEKSSCNVLPDVKRTSDGRLEIILKATKTINPGEQILLWCEASYLKGWKLANYLNPRHLNEKVTGCVLRNDLFTNNNGKNSSKEKPKRIQVSVSDTSLSNKKFKSPNAESGMPSAADSILLGNSDSPSLYAGDSASKSSASNLTIEGADELKMPGYLQNEKTKERKGSISRLKRLNEEDNFADVPKMQGPCDSSSSAQGTSSSAALAASEEKSPLQLAMERLAKEQAQVRHCLSRLLPLVIPSENSVTTLFSAMAQISSENRDKVTGLVIKLLNKVNESADSVAALLVSVSVQIEDF